MGFIITLILVGLVLIFAEILLIPGVGVAGVLGILSMGGSCFYAFYEYDNTTGAIVTAVNVVLIVALTVWILRAKTWKKMSLETNIDSKAVSSEASVLALGDRGKTLTRLAPMGSARFGDYVVEVKALEGMLDPNVDVEVVLIEDNRIYVNTVSEEF
ncbi:MAG: serine protease [Bacteroidales bacterium]|nr:serine protease [Bacteroidales bacterium]